MSDTTVGDILFSRFAKFYHSANLRDFTTYCESRELVARSELTTAEDGHTPFYSDASDQDRGVWDRVFGNLQDFNSLFWNTDGGVPNAYGPITLVFGRAVWKASDDIAVTRENAATEGYDLAACRMEAKELEKCYEKDGKYWRLKCYGLEVSFGVPTLAFEDIERVIVDPVDDTFVERVRDVWVQSGGDGAEVVPRTIGSRDLPEDKLKVYRELVNWASSLGGSVPSTADLRKAVPAGLAEWTRQLKDPLWGPLRQWLEYIYNGSLR